ncbi:MAG: methyltransferase domain-containing protein [Deltaproteobacteria bacterium]|jgi:SAM-dependent methyltransferase|nr:methyltransferase domain-containing protein [Deltaproteobacteria bacterium]
MNSLYSACGLKWNIVHWAKSRLYRHKLGIGASRLEELVAQCGAKPWHLGAIKRRQERRHVCIAGYWLAEYAPRDISIFEPGCGSGANLLWLASRGFHNVSGADIDGAALELCRALQKELGRHFPVFEDDCMQPRHPAERQDVILSVNWLYHIPNASLGGFLEKYLPSLKDNGVLICDIIDDAYNKVKNNQYHTQDAAKPEHERRPSEYTFRMSRRDVAETASQHGLHILHEAVAYAVPQRKVYMLAR